jgi:hypothetical protein
MKRVFVLVPLLMLALIMQASAERACTQMWCQEGLTLDFKGADWPAGRYDFAITLDDAHISCAGELPLKSCDAPNVTCDSEDVTIGESGCALPDGHSFYAILSPTTPERVAVTVTHESGKTFTYDSDVAPVCSYPNGEGCDPHPCCSAVLSADVVFK